MFWSRKPVEDSKIDYCFDGISLQNGRATNMDSLAILERTVNGKQLLLAVVCDGVGSLKSGAVAATMTTRSLMAWFSTLENTQDLLPKLLDEIQLINAEVLDTAEQEGIETATTISVLLLDQQKYYIANAGDSRIYCLSSSRFNQLTQDDTDRSGAITECIGHHERPEVSSAEGKLKENVFLLCSDGMYKRMDISFLKAQMNVQTHDQITAAIDKLANYAIQRGERDNISIAMIKVSNGGKAR